MSAAPHRWLQERLPEWRSEGLVSPEVEAILRARYPVEAAGAGLAQRVLGALGGMLVGAGLIAVIGYNWDAFSTGVRLAFGFVPLAVAQGFAAWTLRRGPAAPGWWRETAAISQALAVGACLAIVTQIYHLGGDWPDLLLAWMWLALPMTCVLRADSGAVFHLAAAGVWAVSRADRGAMEWGGAYLWPVLAAAVVPRWLFSPRSAPSAGVRAVAAVSAAFGLGAAAVQACGGLERVERWAAVTALWGVTAAGAMLLPARAAAQAAGTRGRPELALGGTWLLGQGLALTFGEPAAEAIAGAALGLATPWGLGLAAMVTILACLAVRARRWAVLAVAAIAVLPLLAGLAGEAGPGLLPWLASAHLFALGTTWIVLTFAGRPGAPRAGAFLITLLIVLRMSDSDFSLLTKGAVFIAAGTGFLFFNQRIGRRLAAGRRA